MKYYVTGFMHSNDRTDVALIEKNQPAWQKGLLNGIGGKIEAGESPQEAMAREFHEEAGIVTQAHQWKTFAILERPSQYKVYFLYTCNDDVYNVRSMEKEVVSIYQSNNLPNNVIFNLNWLIPMSLDTELQLDEPVHIEEIKAEKV